MNHDKDFLLTNLIKLKDIHWEVDEDALNAVVEYFRDELRYKMDRDESFANLSHKQKEASFDQYCADTILSINH